MFKKIFKTIFTVILFAYAFCVLFGITFFDYRVGSEKSSVILVNNEIPVTNKQTEEIIEVCVSIEDTAYEIIPDKIEYAVSWVTEKIDKYFP